MKSIGKQRKFVDKTNGIKCREGAKKINDDNSRLFTDQVLAPCAFFLLNGKPPFWNRLLEVQFVDKYLAMDTKSTPGYGNIIHTWVWRQYFVKPLYRLSQQNCFIDFNCLWIVS